MKQISGHVLITAVFSNGALGIRDSGRLLDGTVFAR
jgi:hypothetical protein